MKSFYNVLANTLFVSITNFFIWFALTFWLYLNTQSVLTTAFVGGAFMIVMSLSGFWFGSIVDHHKKKNVLVGSTVLTLVFYIAAIWLYILTPEEAFSSVTNPAVWIFSFALLAGFISSNIRAIVLPTLVTMLVPAENRDKANGMSGIVMGISSLGAGAASGFALAFLGMYWVLVITISLIFLALIHLLFVKIPEPEIVHVDGEKKLVDIKGTVAAIKGVPGLFPLIFFTTFNNLLGGVFMSLMDPYGLSLMSVQAWGILWSVLSTGFIFGGMYIAKKGLGTNPLRTLFTINFITWMSSMFFTIQPSIILLAAGMFIWTTLMPFIEAIEHTIVQKIVPLERQGRVFGLAQSIETASSPLMAFIIGPLAQYAFIPFMTTGAGVALIGSWFGTGQGRGIALVFIIASFVGLSATFLARQSKSYKLLSKTYMEAPEKSAQA